MANMKMVELSPTQMAYGGSAMGRDEGQVVFVPYALPDERIQVSIPPSPKRWVEGTLVDIVEPSADRVTPRCPHFGQGKCGGCQWQHADYAAQLRYKTDVVREQLRRIGGIDEAPVQPCMGMAHPWAYRNNVQLRTSEQGVGYVSEDHHGIFPIHTCYIVNDVIAPLLNAVVAQPLPGVARITLRGSVRTGERMAIVEGESADPVLEILPQECAVLHRDKKGNITARRGDIFFHEWAGGRQWRIHANSFFQVNTEQAEQLLALVRAYMGDDTQDARVLDGYAGAGFFGLSLADTVAQVWLVESHPGAIASAQFHAREQVNVSVVHDTTEKALARWGNRPTPTVAVLDPPRAGCEPLVLESLGKMQVPNIIYVSCDPSTQARDIRRLRDFGYILDVVQPVDLFPHTYHIESVARLRLT